MPRLHKANQFLFFSIFLLFLLMRQNMKIILQCFAHMKIYYLSKKYLNSKIIMEVDPTRWRIHFFQQHNQLDIELEDFESRMRQDNYYLLIVNKIPWKLPRGELIFSRYRQHNSETVQKIRLRPNIIFLFAYIILVFKSFTVMMELCVSTVNIYIVLKMFPK